MTEPRATLALARMIGMIFLAWAGVVAVLGVILMTVGPHPYMGAVSEILFGPSPAGSAPARLRTVMLVLFPKDSEYSITDIFLRRQDAPVLAMMLGLWLAVAIAAIARPIPWPKAPGRWAVGTLALLVGLTGLLGARLVYLNYGLSTDEFMARFDAQILRSGHLLAPISMEWRPFVQGLQPIFRMPVYHGAAWASTYLPVNAAFQGMFALPGFPAAASALWAAVAIAATYGVAQRIWPQRRDAPWIAVVLLASSTQLLVTAMTAYAMTAHLALNMVWLWLFLRGDRRGHAAAAGVAWLTCGLHQVVFHPLFAAPFVAQLWLGRRWRAAAFHTAAYLVIGLFWTFYGSLALHLSGVEPVGAVGASHMVKEVQDLLSRFDVAGVTLMARNLLRFVAWQNPLTVALFVIGLWPAVWRGGALQALTAGFFLTLAAVFVLLPFQGHGWGYRYVHGLLGGVCLVAAGGWVRLVDAVPGRRRALANALAVACAAVWFVLLPWQARQVHDWVAPYARLSEAVRHIDADVVVIDTRGVWYGRDMARNDPLLAERPKVMSLADLDEARIVRLCRDYRVRIFDQPMAARLGVRLSLGAGAVDDRAARLRAVMARLRCGEPPLASGRPGT